MSDSTLPPSPEERDRVRLAPIHDYAADLDIELAALRARLMSTGQALMRAGNAIEETCLAHGPRDLESQVELASAVQRNAVAASAMVSDLLSTAGQLAGIAGAVTEVQS